MKPDAAYLGDSVYVRMDQNFQIELYTYNGLEVLDQVFLEPEVWQALMQWVRERKHLNFPMPS